MNEERTGHLKKEKTSADWQLLLMFKPTYFMNV